MLFVFWYMLLYLNLRRKNMLPTLFIGHGSPLNALQDNLITRKWRDLGKLIKPSAILVLSAHWHTKGLKIAHTPTPRQIYDMYGFPQELYELRYDPSGDSALSLRARELLRSFGAEFDNSWGIDHGIWSVLSHMYPKADIPIVAMSVNLNATLQEQILIGEALYPLREENILIIGSGNIVHNLSLMCWEKQDYGYEWAIEFDNAIKDAILKRDFQRVIESALAQTKTQRCNQSFSTMEHFLPLLNILGTSKDTENVSVFNEIYQYGSTSMTSYIFGDLAKS